jgi:hypothetical protein
LEVVWEVKNFGSWSLTVAKEVLLFFNFAAILENRHFRFFSLQLLYKMAAKLKGTVRERYLTFVNFLTTDPPSPPPPLQFSLVTTHKHK